MSDPDCSFVLGIYQVKESKLSLTQLVVIFVIKYLSAILFILIYLVDSFWSVTRVVFLAGTEKVPSTTF